jgi:hypothetical protein
VPLAEQASNRDIAGEGIKHQLADCLALACVPLFSCTLDSLSRELGVELYRLEK